METKNLIANAQIVINAPADKVWEALINHAKVKKYMFGSDVRLDFKPGSKISFTGEWEGKAFEERGNVLDAEEQKLLCYNTFNPKSEKADKEENYRTITIDLKEEVSLSQDNSESEEMRLHAQKNREMVLEKLKDTVEEK